MISTGKAAFEKHEKIVFRKSTDVSRIIFQWTGLPADRQEYSVVERRKVGNADNEFSSNRQHPAHFMQNPEELFDMLKDLVRYHHVDRTIFEREPITLNIQGMNRDSLVSEESGILIGHFNRM
jgi:hypothetical protein